MKKLIYLTCIGLATCCAVAQTSSVEHKWTVTLKVIDDTGQSVAGANAGVGFFYGPRTEQKNNATSIDGLTDTNGLFVATHLAWGGLLSFVAEKNGYYTVRQSQYDLGFKYDPAKWNPTITLVLKRMIHPIPMYAKWVNTHVPVLDKPVGFDLMAGDWVAPNGKGKDTDILFNAHLDQRTENDFDYKLVVSFPNKGDGIQVFTVPENEKGSDLRSPQEAPEAGYEPQYIKTQSQKPGEPAKYGLNEKLNLFFRVRTVLDEKGNVKSALYGKIYGDFMYFRYYLNPTPNSRGVEFDPSKNLLQKLGPGEGVNVP